MATITIIPLLRYDVFATSGCRLSGEENDFLCAGVGNAVAMGNELGIMGSVTG